MVEISRGNMSNRVIELGTGEDCEIRFLEPIGYAPLPFHPSIDAQVTVVGGRNVVTIGAQTDINSHAETFMTASASSVATALTVASTEGFPEAGILRVGGEGIHYSSKTDTTFTIAERNVGFFIGTGTPPLALAAGTVVYIGEQWRGALSYRSQTGFVHTEGALLEGTSLIDGVRYRGSSATTATLQMSRVGPVGPKDIVAMTDGHADCVQTWGSGVRNLRMSHLSLLGGVNGRCLINAANTSGGGAVENITLIDSDLINYMGRRESLLTNSDSETEWRVANAWLVTNRSGPLAAPELHAMFRREDVGMMGLHGANSNGPDRGPMISRNGLGIGYQSPGYAA